MSANPPRRPGTIADWLAADEDEGLELIDGELIPKAAPTPEHGNAQGGTMLVVRGPFHRAAGGSGGPGGWWIMSEVEVLLDGRGYRPDLAGWRRQRAPEMPRGRPVTLIPDWICEIVSESNREQDTIKKLHRYHQAGVSHHWILDQVDRTLTVHRHTPDGYLIALRTGASERVRAEPFDAIELHVAELLGDDPDEP
ncbi:MAG TPA: Uma2 family endonuclease [Kofleriaceae bacterium]|nr:Uma2 family endonuclease [Kofleriaceae bacterium]